MYWLLIFKKYIFFYLKGGIIKKSLRPWRRDFRALGCCFPRVGSSKILAKADGAGSSAKWDNFKLSHIEIRRAREETCKIFFFLINISIFEELKLNLIKLFVYKCLIDHLALKTSGIE